MLDRVTRPRENRILMECDRLQLGRQQIEARWRKCCEKAVPNSGGTRHTR